MHHVALIKNANRVYYNYLAKWFWEASQSSFRLCFLSIIYLFEYTEIQHVCNIYSIFTHKYLGEIKCRSMLTVFSRLLLCSLQSTRSEPIGLLCCCRILLHISWMWFWPSLVWAPPAWSGTGPPWVWVSGGFLLNSAIVWEDRRRLLASHRRMYERDARSSSALKSPASSSSFCETLSDTTAETFQNREIWPQLGNAFLKR